MLIISLTFRNSVETITIALKFYLLIRAYLIHISYPNLSILFLFPFLPAIFMFAVFDEWGYICDDQFGLRDAHVACKELGFPLGALEVKTSSFFAQSVWDNETYYLMDDVSCLGNESSLRECDFSGWGVHNCMPQEVKYNHTNDIAILLAILHIFLRTCAICFMSKSY